MRKPALAILAVLLVPSFGVLISQQTQAQDPLEEDVRDILLGRLIEQARFARLDGRCGERNHYLAAANEDLAFLQLMRDRNHEDAPSQEAIDEARRAIDREAARRCELTEETRQFADDLRNAPPLPDDLTPVSLLEDGLPSVGLFQEAYRQFRELYRADQPDLGTLWELAEGFRQLMRQLKRQRDAAVAGLGTEDPINRYWAYRTVRTIYWEAMVELERARVQQVRSEQNSTQEQQQEQAPEDDEEQNQQQQVDTNQYFDWSNVRFDTAEQAPLTSNEQVWLDAHNQARRYFGVPELTWNHQLARDATAWAKEMVRLDLPAARHSPRAGRETQRENLLTSLPNQRTPYQMVRVWVLERRYFMPGNYPNVSTTGDWYVVGHFTQVVWPYTTEVGCGMAVSIKVEFFVCRYSPPGNRDGTYIEPNNTRWERG